MRFKFLNSVAVAGLIGAMASVGATSAQAQDLTLCWAAWDPANALFELSKDFER